MSIEKIVVLEDNTGLNRLLSEYLRSQKYDVASAATLAAARRFLAQDRFDLVFADLKLPDGTSLELLKELQQLPERPVVIVMTGDLTVQPAVECMRHGAFYYLTKPYAFDELDVLLERAGELTHLKQVNSYLSQRADKDDDSHILGRAPGIEQVRQLIRRVARTDATVLIHGETGTGKELVAHALHCQSPRASAPFIRVNCAAIPENLIESEFFGHEKGAFTGALTKREGRFELAHGGTILLDEISEIPPALQAKLLRVLQERELERVGGSRTVKVDVRVIATTNRDLQESVRRNEFRQDLYFRLNVVPIHVPALRERREDVALLTEEFLKRYRRKHACHNTTLSAACLSQYANYNWPGNIRELQNVIERTVILCTDTCDNCALKSPTVTTVAAPLPAAEPPATAAAAPVAIPPSTGTTADGVITLAELEKHHILNVLTHAGGNRTQAAKSLDISIRTLRNKLNDYRAAGLTIPGGKGS